MSEFADIVESALGQRLLLPCPIGFDCRGDDSAEKTQKNQSGSGECDLVPPKEFSGAITSSVSAGEDWPRFQMPPDVFGKLLDRLVASLRFFAQRHQHDVVEIAPQ